MTRQQAEEAAKELVRMCTWSLENAGKKCLASLFFGESDVRQLREVLLVLLEEKPVAGLVRNHDSTLGWKP